MKTVAKPKKEEEILASVEKGADKQTIINEMVTKAECCVDHLCGCK